MRADGEDGGRRPEPLSRRGRLLCAVIGVVLLGGGSWYGVALPVEHVADVLGRVAVLAWAAALLFALPVPRGHDRWRVTAVVLLLVPLLAAVVVLGPLGVLAPELVADPDGGGRWPNTSDRAVTTGWIVIGAVLAVLGAYVAARVADRRTRQRREEGRRR